jgi:hypothetical protein
MNLLGIVSMSFDVTDQLLIRFSAFVRYWRKKWEYNETVQQLVIDFKKEYDSVRREVLCNILIQFGVTMKLVRLNSGNACYHSVQNLLYSRLLSKNLKIRIYKTIKIKPSFATIDNMYLFLLITTRFGSHKLPSLGDSRDTKYQSRSYYSYKVSEV